MFFDPGDQQEKRSERVMRTQGCCSSTARLFICLFPTVEEQGPKLQRPVFFPTILSIESINELHHTLSKGDHIIALYIVS